MLGYSHESEALLQIEGATILVASVAPYHFNHGSGWLFAVLFLSPDLSMIGYAFNVRAGAVCYNAAHTYTVPALLVVIAHLFGYATGLSPSLIWIAHIGFDRLLGFGLKDPSRFKDTHLSRERHRAEPARVATA